MRKNGYLIIDNDNDLRREMRSHMRSQMRQWDDGTNRAGKTYEDGYREGYRHGFEDAEHGDPEWDDGYRRERDSRGRYM